MPICLEEGKPSPETICHQALIVTLFYYGIQEESQRPEEKSKVKSLHIFATSQCLPIFLCHFNSSLHSLLKHIYSFRYLISKYPWNRILQMREAVLGTFSPYCHKILQNQLGEGLILTPSLRGYSPLLAWEAWQWGCCTQEIERDEDWCPVGFPISLFFILTRDLAHGWGFPNSLLSWSSLETPSQIHPDLCVS